MARVPKKVLEHFSRIPLFSAVSKKGLSSIVAAADEVTVKPGKDLVREGEHGRHLYVVVEGSVKVIRGGRKVATLGPGDFFGELALVSGAPRTATVTTETDSTLMVLDPRRFEVVMTEEPQVAKAVMATLGDRLRLVERSITH
jgi:CRP/FNR family transcriptional regulator, cyclic AMP receptor protein